jgi:hypothetical protein
MLKKIIIILILVTLTFEKLRKIEILPSVNSKSNFVRRVIEVSEEYIEEKLVGSKDFTFVDITDQKEIIPLKSNFNFPEPRRQTILKPILESVTENSTREFLTKLTSFPHRRSNRVGAQDSVLMIKSELEKIINGLPTERKNRIKIELVKVPRFLADSIIVTFTGSGNDKDEHVLFGAHHDDVGHPNAGFQIYIKTRG